MPIDFSLGAGQPVRVVINNKPANSRTGSLFTALFLDDGYIVPDIALDKKTMALPLHSLNEFLELSP
jgi:hypothetical protein